MSSDNSFSSWVMGISRGLLINVLCTTVISGLVVPATATSSDQLPVFSGIRAMELLVQQCDLGPRTPGSPGNQRLQDLIVKSAKTAGLTSRKQCFEIDDPLGGSRFEACNIVVSTKGGGADDRLWLGAHFDTRPICDRDPDKNSRNKPLVGANDGASGVAVLLHIVEILGENPPQSGVDLIFFDAEDSGHSGAVEGFCLGSRYLAETLDDFSNPLVGIVPRGLILLDMVGEKNLSIPMEGYSLRYSPEWTKEIFQIAVDLNLPAFIMEPGPPVFDDHVPFLNQGIPAVDLIDFSFPQWHTSGDVPAVCSSASLDQVGLLLVNLIYKP